ncbi:MAG: cytochrome c-type biogenesis protein CcmH [Longimicrobiales bacterium]
MIRTLRRRSLGSRATRSFSFGLALTFALVPRVSAQSTGPAHTGYDPAASVGGHYHEGLTGEQALILERSIKCLCSCGLDVHSCQFQMQCDTSPGWSERIRRSLDAGQTPEAIQASFVADYGMQVLMAPPAQGFNLLGYFLPGATILVAGALIGMVARRGMNRSQLAPVTELDDEDAERLRTEMQKLDRSESPDW